MRVGRANGEGWLRLGEAAAELGVSLNTLRRWSDSGKLTCYRSPGGHRRYRRADVETLLRAEDGGGPCPGRPPPAGHLGGHDDGARVPAHPGARRRRRRRRDRVQDLAAPRATAPFRILSARSRAGRARPRGGDRRRGCCPPCGRSCAPAAASSSPTSARRTCSSAPRQRCCASAATPPSWPCRCAVEGRNRAVLELVESRAPRAFTGANVAFAEFMARQAARLLGGRSAATDRAAGRSDCPRRRCPASAALAAARGPAAHPRRPAAPRAGRRRLRHPPLRPRSRTRWSRSPRPRPASLRHCGACCTPRPTSARRRRRSSPASRSLITDLAAIRRRRPSPRAPGAERREERVRRADPPRARGRRPASRCTAARPAGCRTGRSALWSKRRRRRRPSRWPAITTPPSSPAAIAQLDDLIAGFSMHSPAMDAESLVLSTLQALRTRPDFDACTVYRVDGAVASAVPSWRRRRQPGRRRRRRGTLERLPGGGAGRGRPCTRGGHRLMPARHRSLGRRDALILRDPGPHGVVLTPVVFWDRLVGVLEFGSATPQGLATADARRSGGRRPPGRRARQRRRHRPPAAAQPGPRAGRRGGPRGHRPPQHRRGPARRGRAPLRPHPHPRGRHLRRGGRHAARRS